MKRFSVVAMLLVASINSFSFVKTPISPVSKSLIFPVAGKKSFIGSFWGAVRDGGRRKHEGIDIFARKGTAVVAICDGIIVSGGSTPRGGKVLWLQSTSYPMTAYYAHLDQHKARVGQFVRKGQVIGTVGNTGNARYTPAHLHFGIYKYSGAVNPLPYVKNSKKVVAPAPSAKAKPVLVKNNASHTKSIRPTTASSASVSAKDIYKRMKIAADPTANYFMTRKAQVVRLHQGKYQLIGKWKRGTTVEYPYQITMTNNEQVYINRAGQVLTASGKQVGAAS